MNVKVFRVDGGYEFVTHNAAGEVISTVRTTASVGAKLLEKMCESGE